MQSATLKASFAQIDAFVKHNSRFFNNQGKAGRRYIFKDKEILKMLFVRDKEKIASNRDLVGFLRVYCSSWFKKIPDHSTICRREKKLVEAQNLLREYLLTRMVSPKDNVRLVDSTPISTVRYERSSHYRLIPEASYGYCATKKEKYLGFKLSMLTTLSGIPTEFELTPANIHDIRVLEELLYAYQNLTVVGDKGYLDKKLKAKLAWENRQLITPYKKNQSVKNTSFEKKLLKYRKRIETVFNQLKLKFNLVNHQMKDLRGIVARLFSILTNFTLMIWCNVKLKQKSILSTKHVLC